MYEKLLMDLDSWLENRRAKKLPGGALAKAINAIRRLDRMNRERGALSTCKHCQKSTIHPDHRKDGPCFFEPQARRGASSRFRTLMRVDGYDEVEGQIEGVNFVVPGWDYRQRLYIPINELPDTIVSELKKDKRLFATVNLDARYPSQLQPSDWEIPYFLEET